jgi:GDP-4-dehydro-6-deoxy-D-mannose reductase
MKVILVTGSEGFVGSQFILALKEGLYKIVPTCYPLLIPKKSKLVPLDLLNLEMTKDVVKTHGPDVVFHFAAVSSVSKSLRDRPLVYNTNILGTVNLLEALRMLKKDVLLFFISTCEVYGGGDKLTEEAVISLKNPYAVSKYSAELVCRNYELENISCVILRPFTHTGPGQAADFVLPSIAAQISEIEKGKRPPLLELGNTKAKREFIHVKDMVAAYMLALDKCAPGDMYNISSNHGYTIDEALEHFRQFAKAKFEVKREPSKVRKIDIPVLVGNGKKFSKITGWNPKFTFEKTIEDLLNYWRAKR